MPEIYSRLPFNLIDTHGEFVAAHKPNLEIYLSSDTLDSDKPTALADGIKSTMHDGAKHTIHGPFMDMSPGAVDSSVREATHKRFSQTIEVAALSGAKAIVFHSGYEKWKYDHKVEPWLSSSLKFWPAILKQAADAGVKIAIENIFEEEPGNLRLLMDGIDTTNAGICFDVGHFNLFSRMPLKPWMDAIGEYVIEYHLHDNIGDCDAHLPPGDGTFKFEELFTIMKGKDIIWTIEANSPEDTLTSMERLQSIS